MLYVSEVSVKLGRDFPGGLVVRILWFHSHGPGSIPGQGIGIPQAVQFVQEKKKGFKTSYGGEGGGGESHSM